VREKKTSFEVKVEEENVFFF